MKTINVVAALIVKDDHVLIAQRKSGDFDGLWEFPGGKIEPNETPQEALQREILEEFEAKIKVEDIIHTVNYEYPNFILNMDCFVCSIVDDSNVILHDHHQVKWLPLITPVSDVDWVPADIEVYESLLQKLKPSLRNPNIEHTKEDEQV